MTNTTANEFKTPFEFMRELLRSQRQLSTNLSEVMHEMFKDERFPTEAMIEYVNKTVLINEERARKTTEISRSVQEQL